MRVVSVSIVIMRRQSNTYSSGAAFPNLYGQSSKYLLTCILHGESPIISKIGFMVLITGLKHLLGWERLLLFGRFGYVDMIKCLTIKIILFCMLSMVHRYTSLMVVFIRVENCNLYTVEAMSGILFTNMDGLITIRLDHHHLRQSTICQCWYVFCLFIFHYPWTGLRLCTS
jgi:hypothetical protein